MDIDSDSESSGEVIRIDLSDGSESLDPRSEDEESSSKHSTIEVLCDKSFHTQNANYVKTEISIAQDIHDEVYASCVLILEPVSGEEDTFRRAGMGVVLSNLWAEEPRMEKTVRII
jgi:hypothetical protein